MLKSYLKKIFKIANQGDAREESYYSTLEAFLKEAAKSFGKQKIHITTLPKSTEAGNPDFRIWDGKQHIVGYIEAKAPTIENLDLIERSYLFPLYLYPDPDQKDLFSHLKESKERKPNISKKIFSALSETYKTKPSPEDIFYYIYAVFYSDTFRTKYAEFLKTDFPRVPFTKDKSLFKKLAEYGKRLADLHLMQSPELDSPVAKFQGTGDKRVDKIKYDKEGKRVCINNDQYFEGVEENVCQYQIGGYQVCNKWLKDRKGKVLSLDDIKHYCKVATAIKHTINIQKSIDEIYNEAEKDLIDF